MKLVTEGWSKAAMTPEGRVSIVEVEAAGCSASVDAIVAEGCCCWARQQEGRL
jgi:hypothetical protein